VDMIFLAFRKSMLQNKKSCLQQTAFHYEKEKD